MTAIMMVDDGLSGSYDGNSWTVKIALATFLGISWYNAIELCILLLVTFTRYQGLYFWSLFIAGVFGVVPYALGFLLKLFDLLNVYVSIVFLTIGWWAMVTGQSIVLYSRLHLVLRDQATLRRVLWMIIANVFLLHVPTTVLTFGSNSPAKENFREAYKIMEKVQMTGFFIQEVIISTLYIWEAVKLLRLTRESGNRKITYQLLGINLLFIMMDLGLLGAIYAGFYAIETTLKAAIYSIKLKLEFAVLGKLVHLVHIHSWNPEFFAGSNGYPDFVDPNRITSDVTRAPDCANSPPKPPWSLQDESPIMMNDQSKSEHGDNGEHQPARSATTGSARNSSTRLDVTTPDGGMMPIDVTQVIPSQPENHIKWPS